MEQTIDTAEQEKTIIAPSKTEMEQEEVKSECKKTTTEIAHNESKKINRKEIKIGQVSGTLLNGDDGQYYAKIDITIDGEVLPAKKYSIGIPHHITPSCQDQQILGDLCQKVFDYTNRSNKIEAECEYHDLLEVETNKNKRIFSLNEFLEILLRKEAGESVNADSLFTNIKKTKQHDDELKIIYAIMIQTLNYVFRDIPQERNSHLPYLWLSKDKEDKIEQVKENDYQCLVDMILTDYCKCAFLFAFVVLAFENKFHEIVSQEKNAGGVLKLFQRMAVNFPKYDKSSLNNVAQEAPTPKKRKTHPSKRDLIEKKFKSVYDLSSDSEEMAVIKILRSHCDSQQELLGFCKRLATSHASEPDSSPLKPYITAYKEITEQFENCIKQATLEYWNQPLGVFERFSEFTYRERVMILYLFDLQKKYQNKKDIRRSANVQNWWILTTQERHQLAYYLFKLYDDEQTYRKYMPCSHPQEAEDRFLMIIAQLENMRFYEAKCQLDDMLRFATMLSESDYDRDKKIYSSLIAQINNAYELMLEIQKEHELPYAVTDYYNTLRNLTFVNKRSNE